MNKKIIVPISENDAQDIQNGAVFNWTFPVIDSTTGEWIDVQLQLEEDNED